MLIQYKYNKNTTQIQYKYNTNTIQIQYKYNRYKYELNINKKLNTRRLIQYNACNTMQCNTKQINSIQYWHLCTKYHLYHTPDG